MAAQGPVLADGSNLTSLPATGTSKRDGLWDSIKAIAVLRVIAWHTWGWAPLSWFGAMPAMFLASGALLAPSLARDGYALTLRNRLKRLMIPYWVYAGTCIIWMVAHGWHPTTAELLRWLVPVLDPTGPERFAMLWVPLWYLRAYIWMLIASPLLLRGSRRGWLVPALLLVTGSLLPDSTPLVVGDMVTYSAFVVAGMIISSRGLPSIRLCTALGISTAAALGIGLATGTIPLVVNTTYGATALAGVATSALLLSLRTPLRQLSSGRVGAPVTWIGSRALSIYLWQGFGLAVAAGWIWSTDWPRIGKTVAAGFVVFGVTLLLAEALGKVEGLAARRPPKRSHPIILIVFLSLVILISLTNIPTSADGTPVIASGAAILRNAQRVTEEPPPSTSSRPVVDPGLSVRRAELWRVAEEFISTHEDDLAAASSETFEFSVRTNDGLVSLRWSKDNGLHFVEKIKTLRDIPWYSMTKSVTSAWLMTLVEGEVVGLDDPVGKYLDGIPHGSEITLRDLARNRSGISAKFESNESGAGDSGGIDPGAEVRRWIADGSLEFKPGDGFIYSRVGYSLLAWALEEASGETWRQGVEALAEGAGVRLVFDEDVLPSGRSSTHPANNSYSGERYAAGALIGRVDAGANLFWWLYNRSLSPSSVDEIFTFDADERLGLYGLGTRPECPCTKSDGVLYTDLVGNSSVPGWWSLDRSTGSVWMVAPDKYWRGDGDPWPMWEELSRSISEGLQR